MESLKYLKGMFFLQYFFLADLDDNERNLQILHRVSTNSSTGKLISKFS